MLASSVPRPSLLTGRSSQTKVQALGGVLRVSVLDTLTPFNGFVVAALVARNLTCPHTNSALNSHLGEFF